VADATLGSSRRGTVPSDAIEIGSGSSSSFPSEPTTDVERHERRIRPETPVGQEAGFGGGSGDATPRVSWSGRTFAALLKKSPLFRKSAVR
jgi:hypothetical protein